ncbi:MAG: hypothetical protein K940chlam2_00404, partial [Chlamydiae bacterium]|nr:hypothetical protein [Chlamydiota bacterium]
RRRRPIGVGLAMKVAALFPERVPALLGRIVIVLLGEGVVGHSFLLGNPFQFRYVTIVVVGGVERQVKLHRQGGNPHVVRRFFLLGW